MHTSAKLQQTGDTKTPRRGSEKAELAVRSVWVENRSIAKQSHALNPDLFPPEMRPVDENMMASSQYSFSLTPFLHSFLSFSASIPAVLQRPRPSSSAK